MRNRTAIRSLLLASVLGVGAAWAHETAAATANAPYTSVQDAMQRLDRLHAMVGKDVYGENRNLIGRISGIDNEMGMAVIDTPAGKISLAENMLADMGNHVIAADVTGSQVVAQTVPDIIVVITE